METLPKDGDRKCLGVILPLTLAVTAGIDSITLTVTENGWMDE